MTYFKSSLAFCLLFITFTSRADIIPAQASQPFPEYVGALGYPCETHNITTSDGYINTYFRIQAKNSAIQPNLPVVYLQHGLLDSADTFIVNSEDQAIAFIVANLGFDVWVGNTRGNTYSQSRVSSSSDTSDSDSSYWNFSFQEMSLYDLPAAFQYIAQATSQKITYIGHSQGTSIMFAALIRQDQTIIQNLKYYIALGPVVYIDNILSPEVNLASQARLGIILEAFNKKEFLVLNDVERGALELLCVVADAACISQLQLIFDTQTDVDNLSRMGVIMGHFPAGTSVQNFDYWNQLMLSQNFTMFDYGTQGNLNSYGQATPPIYDLSLINVPVYLFAGTYDEIAYLSSTEKIRDQLTGSPHVFYQTYPLGHMSFVWGNNVTGYFNDVLSIIQN